MTMKALRGSSLYIRTHRKPLAVLLFMTAVYFFANFQRVAIPGTIFDELQTDLGIAASQVALLGAIYLYIYGGMQLLVGIMVDRFGYSRVFLGGAACLCIGSFLFPASHEILTLYGSRALIGFGCSMLYMSIVKALDRLFDARHFALLLGTFLFLGYMGGLFATYPFAALVKGTGWRIGLVIVAVATLSATLAAAWVLRRAPAAPSTVAARRTIGVVLRNHRTYPVLIACALNYGIYFVVQATIGKKLLSDCFHISGGAAAAVMFAMMLTCMASTFLSGVMVRLMGNRCKGLLVGATALTCGTSLAMVFAVGQSAAGGGGWAVRVGYLLLAVAGSVAPVFSAVMKAHSPGDATGTALGLLNGLSYLAVAILANATGIALDWYQPEAVRVATAWIYPPQAYQAVLLGCAGVGLVAVLAALRIRESADGGVTAG